MPLLQPINIWKILLAPAIMIIKTMGTTRPSVGLPRRIAYLHSLADAIVLNFCGGFGEYRR